MVTLTPEQSNRASQRLAAGRIRAMDRMPYLSKSLLAMIPQSRPGLKTFAVDKRWRMYYDPQLCLDWTIDELAAAWLHECSHLVRRHAQRFERVESGDAQYAEQWNHAADAAINSDLSEIDIVLQDANNRFYAQANPLYPQWRSGMTTEQMYEIARKKFGADKEKTNKDEGATDAIDDIEDIRNHAQEFPLEDGHSSHENTDSDSQGSQGLQDSFAADTPPEDGTLDEHEKEGSSGSPNSNEHNDTANESDSEDISDAETGCGSGASGGPPRDYEEQDLNDGSLDPFDAEQVREETARDIMDASRAGTVPGGLIRSADEILNPQIDWQSQLSRWMRRTVAQVIGQSDYSFSRRSRSSFQTPFYLPGLRDREPPVVKIVLDTSGSMQPEDLARGISEVCAILDQSQRNSGESIELINCDAGAHSTDKIRDISQIVIRGGGGTDMRVGMKVAAEARPRADVVLVITDGGTPWMEEPPIANPRAAYVVLLVEQKKGRGIDKIAERIPQWMHVIPTYR